MANDQTSPGNAPLPSRLCPPHIQGKIPGKYWTLKLNAFSSSPPASCGFCTSGQRFAFTFLQIPPRDRHPWRSANGSPYRVRTGLGDFSPHPQVGAPCRAHNRNGRFRRSGHPLSEVCGALPGLVPVLSLLLLALVRRYLLELSFSSAGHFGISLTRGGTGRPELLPSELGRGA